MRKFFLTVGYSGLFPYASGTIGTIVSIPFALLILAYCPPETLMMGALLVTVIGIREVDKYEQETNTHDSKIIVIDELAGVWIAIAISGGTWIQIVFSFIMFRVFDIWKPSIIGRIDREMSGGKGVMLDDVVAGFFGGFASALLYKGYLMIS